MKEEKYAPSNMSSRARTPEALEMFNAIDKYSIYHEASPISAVYHINPNVYSIAISGSNWVYLIKGPQKAMLVDTGFGLSDLKGLCEELVGDMPIIVVNTHDHFDHVGGNFQFDTVYIHLYDAASLIKDIRPEKYYEFNGKDHKNLLDIYHVPFKDYNVVAFTDGYQFDLGDGYIIDTVRVPGHSPGGCVFVDKQAGICFTGDCTIGMISGPKSPEQFHGEECTFEAYRDGLIKLIEHLDGIEYMYSGHTLSYNNELVISSPKGVFSRLALCDKLVSNPESCVLEDLSIHNGKRVVKCVRADGEMLVIGGEKAIFRNR